MDGEAQHHHIELRNRALLIPGCQYPGMRVETPMKITDAPTSYLVATPWRTYPALELVFSITHSLAVAPLYNQLCISIIGPA